MSVKPVQIKICGITKIEDALKCVELGANLIGLNFYRESPRYTEPTIAREIVATLPRNVCAVGVFVETNADDVRKTAAIVDLQCVQLHGSVSAETCRKLAPEFRVIRAFCTDNHFRPEDARAFSECDILIDAHHPELHGGTGQTCDWQVARATLPLVRFLILSGGLNPRNIREAIATVSPDAIDVCSGVESGPGMKDHRAIEELITAIRT